MSDRKTELLEFLKKELAQDHPGVDLATEPLVESGIIDSLGIMKLVQFLEQRYQLKIGDQDLVPDNFENLDAILRLLAEKGR